MTQAQTQQAGRVVHMQERRELKDYPGYFVSREGKVYNSEGVERPVYLSGVPEYKYVSLPANNAKGWQIRRVHILVAKAFIPNPDNLPMVNHIDENKLNSIYTNLEWCDQGHNVRHSLGSRRDMKGVSRPTYAPSFQKEVVAHYVHQVNRGKRSKRAVWLKFGISSRTLDSWIAKWM